SFEELSQAGFEMEWKNAAQVRAESGCPILGGAIFQRQDGGLDPARFCRGLAALSGAQIRQGSRVRALSPDGDAVRVEGDGFDLRARRVVVALNAFVPTLLPSLAGKVWPVRGQMMATAPAARSLRGVWYIDDGFEYARQLSDGTFLLGGCRREAMEEEVGFMAAPTARIQGALDDYRQRAFPAFAELPVLRRWAGTMAFTEDGLPLVGEVPDVPGAVYAAGFNGHGMSLGFVYGKHLAERALGRPAEPLF
ncbi:MAG: FAD-dependent oxidoreductase, partial [Thermoanaerobaculia bacterium]